MKDSLYKAMIFILLLMIIFLLPTSSLISKIIFITTNISNTSFHFLVKILIYLIICKIYIKYRYEYIGKEDIIEFFLKNTSLCITIFFIVFEIIVTIILIYLDRSLIINITSDAWITYLCNMSSLTIAALGIILTLNSYIKDRETAEKPKIGMYITPLIDDVKFIANVDMDSEYGYIKEICIKIENKSEHNIYTPRIEDNNLYGYGLQYIIEFNSNYSILEQIDSKNNVNTCFEIVKFNIRVDEGMSEKIEKTFGLVYEYNNKMYKNNVRVIFHKSNGEVALRISDTERIYGRRAKYAQG